MAESEEELKSLLMKVKECEKAGLKLNIHFGEGNSTPHSQYSCLEKSMDRGAWRAAVHGVTWLNMHA